MGEKGQMRVELDRALHRLAESGRQEDYVAKITTLVTTNFTRGRVAHFIDGNLQVTVADYVDVVVAEYDAQHSYVERVQERRETAVWEPLFEKLQKWSYNLIRTRLQTNPHRERMEHAVNCASDAGAAIVNSYFPYDTAFEAWMYVLLNYTVNKYIRELPGFKENGHLPHIHLDEWPEWSDNLADPDAERALSRYEKQQILAQVIRKLPPGQQEVVALLFGPDALSYSEIAEKTGRSYSALYKAKFDALENLREYLSEAEYIYL